jgi:predicted dehydrogenase
MAIRLAIVGCGGMGHRHVRGLQELQTAGLAALELVAACDPVHANALSLADEAERRLGARPAIVASLPELADHAVAAVDITSSPRSHHELAVAALQRGWHVLIEKPLGVTVAACAQIHAAAQTAAAVLSVAENYRRDPLNRLAKALLDAGVIGTPRLFLQHSVGGGDRMAISLWRHRRDDSGILLDAGVHYTDMMEYLLGEIDSVFAATRLHEPIRRNPAAAAAGDGDGDDKRGAIDPGGAYAQFQAAMPAQFEATAEDALYATLSFKSGAVGQLVEDHAGHGEAVWARSIHGSLGSMRLPGDRSGAGIVVDLTDGQRIEGEALLARVPDFTLDPATARLFGSERLSGYANTFATVDAKLLATEYAEFARAIEHGDPVEIGSAEGMRAVACCYALLESGATQAPVAIADALNGRAATYQRQLDQSLGLVPR